MVDTGVSDTIQCVPTLLLSLPSVPLSGTRTPGPLVSKCLDTCNYDTDTAALEGEGGKWLKQTGGVPRRHPKHPWLANYSTCPPRHFRLQRAIKEGMAMAEKHYWFS